jgi:hypothetical protein
MGDGDENGVEAGEEGDDGSELPLQDLGTWDTPCQSDCEPRKNFSTKGGSGTRPG